MTTETNCMFCKMASGDFQVEKLYEDGLCFAIHDIAGRAPTHVLLISKHHIASAGTITTDQAPLVGHMVTVGQEIARKQRVFDSGYRLAMNVGEDGGQSIYHLHMHLLGGRKLGPEG